MPIYEFTCKNCHKEFEQLMFKSDDKPVCPYCQSNEAQKLMSACSSSGHKGGSCAGSCSSCAGCGH